MDILTIAFCCLVLAGFVGMGFTRLFMVPDVSTGAWNGKPSKYNRRRK